MVLAENILQSVANFRLSKASSERIGLFLEFCRIVLSGILIYFQQLLKCILPAKRKSLKGEVILITGSAGGLGQEMCKQLATSGAKLVLWDVCSQANQETAQMLRDLGAEQVYEDTVDLSDREQVVIAADKVRRSIGHVTILINNAGIAPVYQFLDFNPAAVRKTFEVNVISHFWTIQEFLPQMIANNHGHIVTVASALAHITMRGSAPYSASKHSVHGFLECLKDELANKGCTNIKFTTAYPFFIKTNLLQDTNLTLKFRFPWLTPFLEVSYVAEKIIEGICCEKEFVYVPRSHHFYLMIKPFVPTRLHQIIGDFLVEEFNIPSPSESQKVPPAKIVQENGKILQQNNNLFQETIKSR